MESISIRIDAATLRALNRIAPTAQRTRAKFVRAAICKAIMQAGEERTRLAYLEHPDTETADDGWRDAEEWKP